MKDFYDPKSFPTTFLGTKVRALLRKSVIALFSLVLLSSTCSTDEDMDPVTDPDLNPPTAGVVKSTVTGIFFRNNGAKNPTLISFLNGTQSLPGFEVKPDGSAQIKFFGKNGRDLLQGNARGASSNMFTWDLYDGDTIRIYLGGALKYEYVTKTLENTMDDRISFTSIGETELQAKTRFNEYVKNEMPTQKFKPL